MRLSGSMGRPDYAAMTLAEMLAANGHTSVDVLNVDRLVITLCVDYLCSCRRDRGTKRAAVHHRPRARRVRAPSRGLLALRGVRRLPRPGSFCQRVVVRGLIARALAPR